MASEYSGAATRARAEELARAIGAVHTSIKIDAMTSAVRATFEDISLHTDQFERASMRTKPAMEGGTVTENLALQNIQARSRMVLSYTLAQLLPWTRDRPSFLLVLGSANVDEALAGYAMGRVSDLAPRTRKPHIAHLALLPSTAT